MVDPILAHASPSTARALLGSKDARLLLPTGNPAPTIANRRRRRCGARLLDAGPRESQPLQPVVGQALTPVGRSPRLHRVVHLASWRKVYAVYGTWLAFKVICLIVLTCPSKAGEVYMVKDKIKAFFSWVPGVEAPVEPADQAPKRAGPTPQVQPTAARSEQPELQNIKGIGPGIVRKLDSLGVRTYADLAAADPDTLAKQLDTRPVTPQKVRGWISKAKKRAG
jgi:predicted flap endonuclease-1-like 5' DNA nuclease